MRFKIGDVVKYLKHPKTKHIINQEALRSDGTFEYSTHLIAWLTSNELQLIKKASKRSIKKLLKYYDEDHE